MERGRDAAALTLVPVATHTAPGTPPHRVTTEGGHWHRRAICLQGMEALEPPRHHHRAIGMQAATPMSDHHTKQPPSLAPVTPIPPPAHHPTKLPPCKGMKRDSAPHTPTHRAIRMQAATPMSDRVVTSHTHTDIITSPPAHHHHITTARHIELLPCKEMIFYHISLFKSMVITFSFLSGSALRSEMKQKDF